MRYYLTQRPPAPGSFPRQAKRIEAFDTKMFIEEIGREAWGFVEYDEPLSKDEVYSYELTRAVRRISVPTRVIGILEGDKGMLEFVSIGDYGKDANVKADFLGLDREIKGVPNGTIMPLEEKWVVTISTQYGCSMNCKFCDVPLVGRGVNATLKDLNRQISAGLNSFTDVKHTKRLNVHYARMGEPTFNPNVLDHAMGLKTLVSQHKVSAKTVHPVISTMMPKNNKFLDALLYQWCIIKNDEYNGEAGLQLSINSTCNKQRDYLFSGNALALEDVARAAEKLPAPVGRKYALNFALADSSIIDAKVLRRLFDPSKFMVKITPMHETRACVKAGLLTSEGYSAYAPYQDVEEAVKAAGFDVLVFIPSLDEDESRITCGNAILAYDELLENNRKEST